MVKLVMILSLIMFSAAVFAESEWEYQVVFLPGPAAGTKLVRQPHGGYLDSTKTDILNKLAAQGWELVTVTAHSGEDNAAYLRREK